MIPNLKHNHIGRKIERIRELKGIKQETLAAEIGVTQQAISKIEQSAIVDQDKLERIAKALNVTVETIKNFNEESAINFISSTFNHSGIFNYNCTLTFNPIDKLLELYEQTLKDKNELLRQKDEIIEMFKRQQRTS
jgi:transcriptional regulator with XRE-family HTH domain